MIQTHPTAERLEKLEYASSEKEQRKKLLQVEVTLPAILNSPPVLEAHFNQYFAQQLTMLRREIDDGMYVAMLPQPNRVLVKLSDHRLKILLFRAKKK